MLVLSRRDGASIKIGENVKVTVLSSRRDRVRLGIEAPEDVRILREELEAEEEKALPPEDVEQAPPRMRIVLVIEDDPLHARLICRALCRDQGTMVTVAESARRGLSALGALAGDGEIVQPDLILLDMRLPDSSGLEVLRAIRGEDRLGCTPVVMLSCCQDDSLARQCIDNGANAYVVKSPRWEEFRTSVNRIGQFWMNESFTHKHYHRPACDSSSSEKSAARKTVETN